MDIDKIVSILKSGGVVLLPTDTIYGLMCDATNTTAVDKIYRMKGRDYSKPMLILASSKEMLNEYCTNIGNLEEEIIDLYLPGELTIILEKTKKVPDLVTASKSTVGVRVPNNKELIDIIEKLGKPLVSTSANISNKGSSNSIDEIDDTIKKEVDYIYDIGTIDNKESTIVKVENDEVLILREGLLAQPIKKRFGCKKD